MAFLKQLYYTNPRQAAMLIGGVIALVGVLVGGLLGFTGLLITLAIVVALAGGMLALSSLDLGMWGIVAVICLLPFATVPVKIVITPTFMNLAMGATLMVYALQWMAGYRRRLMTTPAHGLVIAFAVFAVFAFIVGMKNGPLTSTLARKFAEFVLTIGFSLVVVDYVREQRQLEQMVRVILLLGAAAAVIGIGLWLLPEELANQLLNGLQPLGYPGGFVLRYIEDNPENAQRAIGTSVDPNAFGGLLAMVGALAAPQLVARRPVFRWWWLTWGVFGLVMVALILTFSRAAMAGLVIAMGFLAVLRYRKLIPWMVVGAALLLLLPVTQGYVARFVEGIQGQDLATQMRFGEYKDAFILLGRYPVFGVGFAGAPDVDIYLGVANAYLTIAQEMGFVGLAIFVLVLVVVFGYGLVHRHRVYAIPGLAGGWLGVHAGLVAALVVGFFDHYFVNLEFQPAQSIFWLFVGLGLAGTRLAGVAVVFRGAAPDGDM